ncbi:MAG: YihY/virulence factor BrkB family protein [Hyphomonadaceae bacterium]|nr:YihY/virulence factor BrkB family protein [Clostridia bacterium]
MRLVKQLIMNIFNHEIAALASQLAYALIFSFFPFAYLLTMILSFIQLNSIDLVSSFTNMLPSYALVALQEGLGNSARQSNEPWLWVVVIAWIGAASNGMNVLMLTFRRAFGEREGKRFWLLNYLKSIVMMLFLGVGLVLSFGLIVIGNQWETWFQNNIDMRGLHFIWSILRYVFVLLMPTVLFAVIYKAALPIHIHWRVVFTGAFFASLGWLISSWGFSWVAMTFLKFSIYGSLGGVMLFLIWLYLLSFIFLLGGEIITSWKMYK